MKHKKASIITLVIVCALIAISIVSTPEKRTIRYFNNHRTILEEDIFSSIEDGQATSRLGITFNYWDGEHPIIEYVVVSQGFVSASSYYGFFYSFDNTPVAFQNTNEPLTSISEHEWEWNGDGDNHGIVRRIDTNWFYFEASF